MSAPHSQRIELAALLECIAVSEKPGPAFKIGCSLAIPAHKWFHLRDRILDALRAEQSGPAERDAVLEEAAKEVEDRIGLPGSYAAGDDDADKIRDEECKLIARSLRALKNAAPQASGSFVDGTATGNIRASLPARASSEDQSPSASSAPTEGADGASPSTRGPSSEAGKERGTWDNNALYAMAQAALQSCPKLGYMDTATKVVRAVIRAQEELCATSETPGGDRG